MTDGTPQRVRIVEGLPSLRRWMVEVLQSEFDVVASDVWKDGDVDQADVLVIDVDAASHTDRVDLQELAEDNGVDVVCCGVRRPTNLPQEVEWLPRPFEADILQKACRTADARTSASLEFEDETHDVAPPDDFIVEDTTPDGQTGGPNAGGDGNQQSEQSTVVSDVVEIDDTSSMIVDVRDVEQGSQGGSWVGDVRREAVDVERALERAEQLHQSTRGGSDEPGRRTMPEVPVEQLEENSEPNSPGSSEVGSRPDSRGTDARRRGGSSVSQLVSTLAEPVRRAIRNTSELLAEEWQRLSLVARREDRARRVHRLMIKTFADGEESGRRELDRIPHDSGMSGDLGIMSLRTLCEALANEGRRGRLEVHADDETVVLYLAGDRLDAVEDLGGREDQLLLECLEDLGAVDAAQVRDLRGRVREEMSPPLRMILRTESIVDDDVILQARRARAHRMLRPMVGRDDGFFSFAEVPRGEDSSWPPEPLRLPMHDALGPTDDDPSSSTSLHGKDVQQESVNSEGTVQADIPSGIGRQSHSDSESTAEREAVNPDDDPTEDL